MDKVVLVNSDNDVIGFEDKIVAHQRGLLHRAFSIIIYNDRRELLLQRRADTKYHTPGLWTNTCCSHPFIDEGYKEAVNRRLEEEMGMSTYLTKYCSFIYKAKLNNNLIEHEHDTVFLGQSNSLPQINKDEVCDYKYISYEDLEQQIEHNPNKFTPWFKLIIEKLDKDFFIKKHFNYA